MKRAVLLGVIVLAGCTTTASEDLPSDSINASQPLIATRDFVVAGNLPENHSNFPMYGMLALSDHSRRKNRKRNKWVCETFQNLPQTTIMQGTGIGTISDDRITPTYWLLVQDTDRRDCAQIIDSYDFERARALFSLAGRAGETGPMLIAVKGKEVGVLDISKAKKKWVRAMVAKWSQSMQAANMDDINVANGPIADTCAILTGNEARRVQAAVWEVVGDDVTDGTPWWQSLANTARSFATELLPFGNKVEKYANKTCDEVNRDGNMA
jgi:hypothetical protein